MKICTLLKMTLCVIAMCASYVLPVATCRGQTLDLWVNSSTGSVSLHNSSFSSTVPLDAYTIQSYTGSLNPASFVGFAANGVAGWESVGASANALSELNLSSSSTVRIGASYSLSNAFTPNGTQDLQLQFTEPSSSLTQTGNVVYTNVVQLRVIALLNNGGASIQSTASVIVNGSSSSIGIDGYTISSGSGSLTSGGLNGFAAQSVPGWESVTPSTHALSELNLTSSATLVTGGSRVLGSIFAASGSHDVAFTYSDPSSPALKQATVLYSAQLAGDANSDGFVNGLDISLISSNWLHTSSLPGDINYDGVVNGLDIAMIAGNWLHSLGAGGVGSGSGTAMGVPEPNAAAMLLVGIAMCASSAYSRRRGRPQVCKAAA